MTVSAAEATGVANEGNAEYAFEPSFDANVFLSYCHSDDDHLKGAIAKLIEAVAEEYQFQFENKLRTFIDEESINWGDDWRKAIHAEIERTNFIVPAITPTYLTRSSCRKELESF